MIPRFRQSYSKTLLNGCPGELKAMLDARRRASTVMDRGSVVDQLVFGRGNYHVITAKYKSGPRKGEPVESWTPDAKAEQDALADGRPCVFAKEEETLKAAAGRVRYELLQRGIDLESPDVVSQEEVTWLGRDGTPMTGTPDIVVRNAQLTVDLKYGEEINPHALRRLIWSMCWDIQGAAYQEAYGFKGGTHAIARANAHCFVMVTLSPLALRVGHERLDHARSIWRECIINGEWPWWKDCTVDPPQHELDRWYARRAESQQEAAE